MVSTGVGGSVLTLAPADEEGTPLLTEADPEADAEAEFPPEALALAEPEAEALAALISVTSI